MQDTYEVRLKYDPNGTMVQLFVNEGENPMKVIPQVCPNCGSALFDQPPFVERDYSDKGVPALIYDCGLTFNYRYKALSTPIRESIEPCKHPIMEK